MHTNGLNESVLSNCSCNGANMGGSLLIQLEHTWALLPICFDSPNYHVCCTKSHKKKKKAHDITTFTSYLCKVSICSHINIRLYKYLTALGLETPRQFNWVWRPWGKSAEPLAWPLTSKDRRQGLTQCSFLSDRNAVCWAKACKQFMSVLWPPMQFHGNF